MNNNSGDTEYPPILKFKIINLSNMTMNVHTDKKITSLPTRTREKISHTQRVCKIHNTKPNIGIQTEKSYKSCNQHQTIQNKIYTRIASKKPTKGKGTETTEKSRKRSLGAMSMNASDDDADINQDTISPNPPAKKRKVTPHVNNS